MFFVRISEKTKNSDYFPVLPSLVLIIQTECVYCAVRAAALNISNPSQILISKTVSWLSHFRRQLHNAETRFRSQVSPSEFCGGHCGSGSGFSPNTSVFFCEYYTTSTRYTSTCCCYLEKKTRKEGTFDREVRISIISFVAKGLANQ
jgi:hypothetical protein